MRTAEPPREDLYALLGVEPHADEALVRRAWRRRAREWHPDVSTAADAPARMAQLNAAYEWLSDPVRRARYDQARGRLRLPPDAWSLAEDPGRDTRARHAGRRSEAHTDPVGTLLRCVSRLDSAELAALEVAGRPSVASIDVSAARTRARDAFAEAGDTAGQRDARRAILAQVAREIDEALAVARHRTRVRYSEGARTAVADAALAVMAVDLIERDVFDDLAGPWFSVLPGTPSLDRRRHRIPLDRDRPGIVARALRTIALALRRADGRR